MTNQTREVIEDLAVLGYTVTYLGKGLGEYNQRLLVTGEMYQAEVSCTSTGEYQLRYKIYPPSNRNTVKWGHELDVDALEDLRDIVEPNVGMLAEWVVQSEPFAYILDIETNKVRNML